MSQRFPTIAPQSNLNRTRALARVQALPRLPCLPWLELGLGLALLMILHHV